jgi:TrmH family RNA methyltransferase
MWARAIPHTPPKLKLLTLARDLRRRKARERQHLFVAEGVRAVEELLRSPLALRGALVGPQLADAPRGEALLAALEAHPVEVEEVSALEFGSAAETESPQGVIAIAEVPRRSVDSIAGDWKGVILVLDGVQDPGNVGTILRTAAGLGAAATIAMPGTVDLWNAKVVRSGMGAHFHHLAFAAGWTELDRLRGDGRAAPMYAADAAGGALPRPLPERALLAVGNEGAGLSVEARDRAAGLVGLRIAPEIESLNVAVATGILLYQFQQ